MANEQQLHGKTIVITGASSGVGRAAAVEMARQGANVVLAARREDALQQVADECAAFGIKTLIVPTDVTDAGAVNTLAATAQHWGGRIDAWINNAGLLAAGPFDEMPISIHDKIISTNLIGYVHGAHAVLPHFKAQGYGVLINNISVGGWFVTPYAAAYTASKFGIRGFGEALQAELHNYPDINVCNLYPAFLDTPGMQHAANFTGRALKPAPPVYDPQDVAKAMAKLVRKPKATTSVGAMSPLLRISYALAPDLSRWATTNVIELYLRNADPSAATSGNVLEPVEYGTSIHGGWGMRPKKSQTLQLAAVVFVLAAGLAIWSKKKIADSTFCAAV